MSHWDSTPLYAHPVDAWILHTLNSTPVKAVINKAIDALVSFQFGHELAGGVFIDRNSFPELFDTLIHCSKTLGIPLPHAVAKHDLSLFNAYTAGTDEYAFINVSSALCEYFTGDEVRFIIGHECGHIASGHMVYHTLVNVLTGVTLNTLGPLGQILRATAGVPLMAWSRRSEVTADRAGLLCCGDVHVAERALLRLVTGFAGVEQVDLEDYLRRFKSMHEFHKLGSLHEYMASHPMIPKRIEALRLFADSELYYSLSGKRHPTGKALLTREQLDRRVKEIVKP
jgi:Zn-dependent protease with chaperone function